MFRLCYAAAYARAQVRAALRSANALEFVEALPEGLDTRLPWLPQPSRSRVLFLDNF